MRIAGYSLHPSEEPILAPHGKSGAVFFSGCALRCVFCQNFDLSRGKRGKVVTPRILADVFKKLEDLGAENIDLVSPSQFALEVAEALSLYKPRVPVLYNTHGYERVETLKLLDPYIDVYLPDLKFYSAESAARYTGRSDYFEYASRAIEFMAKKPVRISPDGQMTSGILVRHLVLPMGVEDSKRALAFLAGVLPKDAYVSVMAQYTPFGEIDAYPELKRSLTRREYRAVAEAAKALPLKNVYLQGLSSSGEEFIPDWDDLLLP